LETVEEVRVVCGAVSRPGNVLALPGSSLSELAGAGAQRVSVGGGLTWIAVGAMVSAATAIRDKGDLSSLATELPLELWLT
ncbi:MAG: isocitrate lyase/phosphoenolpyruvate mutase family protein, partial [Actinomycetota bacterium]